MDAHLSRLEEHIVNKEETLRDNEKGRISRNSSDYGITVYPMENDEVLEEILRYDIKEEDAFFNGVLGGNQGHANVGRNVYGSEIAAHSGLARYNKE